MPTIREMQNPDLTLCPNGLHQEGEEDHCLCPKCESQGEHCVTCPECLERWNKRRKDDSHYPRGADHVITFCDEFINKCRENKNG